MHLTSKDSLATNVGMKTLLAILFALSACGDDPAATPDAAQPAADAAIDSPAAPARGCMGNLPNSRTITINTGDPIPPGLINEIQDNLVGDKRAQYRDPQFLACWATAGTAAALAVNPKGTIITNKYPVWQLPAGAGPTVYTARIHFQPGAKIVGFEIELFGDASADITFDVNYSAGIGNNTASSVLNQVVNNTPADWVTQALTVDNETTLAAGGSLYIAMSISGGTIYVGDVIPILKRP